MPISRNLRQVPAIAKAPTDALDWGLESLADPGSHCEPIEIVGEFLPMLPNMLERMILIRATEEKIADNVANGKVRCPCHLAIGQEAAAVGVAASLRESDRVFGAHRSHAHFLALGCSVHGLLAEVLGKATGVSKGMGGSMHLIDIARGLYGTVPIVGATIPIAVGAGLAAKMDGRGDVAVTFFGDGATEEGGFHESMNLAVTLGAPVLFVCENNLFSSHLHISLRQPASSVARYAEAHRVEWRRVDGNDVVAVAAAARELVSEMRENPSPKFLELVTYRWRGHVGHREDEDVGVARKDDLAGWKQRDPVRRLAEGLAAKGVISQPEFEKMELEVKRLVNKAWAQAEADPFPDESSLLGTVYADQRSGATT